MLKRDAEVPEDITDEDEALEYLRQQGLGEELDTMLDLRDHFRSGQAIRD